MRSHVLPPFIGLTMVLAVGVAFMLMRGGSMPVTAEIVVEHTKPIVMALRLSTLTGGVIVDLKQDATEDTHVSVPSSWKRMEVQHVALSQVLSDPPGLGFTRWALPKGAGITFAAEPFASLSMQNPSGIPLQIKLTTVDLRTHRVEKKSILLQEGPIYMYPST